jgi:hypothetical protein
MGGGRAQSHAVKGKKEAVAVGALLGDSESMRALARLRVSCRSALPYALVLPRAGLGGRLRSHWRMQEYEVRLARLYDL